MIKNKQNYVIISGLVISILFSGLFLLGNNAKAYDSVTFSINKYNFMVGEHWTLTINSNQPHSPVTICSRTPSPSGNTCTPAGNLGLSASTDFNGNWSATSTPTNNEIGSWDEYVVINGVSSNDVYFTISAVATPTPTYTPTPTPVPYCSVFPWLCQNPTPTPVVTPTPTPILPCANGTQLSLEEFRNGVNRGLISISIDAASYSYQTTATIRNNTGCTAPVSLSSYKMFDSSLSTQKLFDRTALTTVGANSSLTLNAHLPDCKAQIDFWYGLAPTQLLDSNPYGHAPEPNVFAFGFTSKGFCTIATPTPTPVPTPTPTPTPTSTPTPTPTPVAGFCSVFPWLCQTPTPTPTPTVSLCTVFPWLCQNPTPTPYASVPYITAQGGYQNCDGTIAPIRINWNAASGNGTYGYNVKRSNNSGGPYYVVAGNINSTSYTDNNSRNPGYYVVTALNYGGETANSNEAYAGFASSYCSYNPTPTPYYYYPTYTPSPTQTISIQKFGKNITKGENDERTSVNARPSDTIEFVIRVRSTSSNTLYNVNISDNLPSGLNYINGTTSLNGTIVSDGINGYGINIGSLSPNQEDVIKIDATVSQVSAFAIGTTTLTNNATVRADGSSTFTAQMPIYVAKDGKVLGASIAKVAGVATGTKESLILSIMLSALVTYIYFGYSQTDLFKKHEALNLVKRSRTDKNKFNFANRV